jgi:predicted ATPase
MSGWRRIGCCRSSDLGRRSQADGGQQRDRLFAAIAELLSAAARRRETAMVVEDVHWADATTPDCLTFLTRPRRDAAVTVVATCRSDETSLQPQVAEWLTQVRGRGGVAEVRLGPLSQDEMAEQVAELAGSSASAQLSMSCTHGQRGTRSSPSSWSRPWSARRTVCSIPTRRCQHG